MKNTSYLLLGAAILLLLTGGYLAYTHSIEKDAAAKNASSTASVRYQSATYGFAFAVPEGYTYKEYVPESVSVGTPQGEDGFASIADVRVYTTGAENSDRGYEDFVKETLKNMCAADGPSETIYCSAVEEEQPFANSSGLTGEALYLRRVHENLATRASTTDTFGPVFVFNIGANVPTQQFAVLAIEPPANLPESAIDGSRIRRIAESVTIDVVAAAPRISRFALLEGLTTSATSTVLSVDEVEYLEGDAAREAAAADSACAEDAVENCAPTLAAGFYIRNTSTSSESYPLSPRAEIILGGERRAITDLAERLAGDTAPLPAALKLQDGIVIQIEELSMP